MKTKFDLGWFIDRFYNLPTKSDMGRPLKTERPPFGEHLLALRLRAKVTLQELAMETEIPIATLNYWERSGNVRNRIEFIALAKALKVPVAVLLNATNAPPLTMREVLTGNAKSLKQRKRKVSDYDLDTHKDPLKPEDLNKGKDSI